MKLFIHFGIYKAGSSFIQYVSSNSREYLKLHGIYFPLSKNDLNMIRGEISDGNADGLNQAIEERNERGIKNILSKWRDEALVNDCNSVLISGEALIHQFAKRDNGKLVLRVARNLGFDSVHVFGFFRDLADHALSTYKHRAKQGTIPDFEQWLTKTYETPRLLEDLVHERENSPDIFWSFRKFVPDSNVLLHIFFLEWLKIPKPPKIQVNRVNDSVTLSEILVMNEIQNKYPHVTDYFVNGFKSLSKEEKAQNKKLDQKFATIAMKNLSKYQNLLDSFNSYLNPEENLRLSSVPIPLNVEDKSPLEIKLSKKQMEILVSDFAYFQTFHGKMFLLRRRVKILLPERLIVLLLRLLVPKRYLG